MPVVKTASPLIFVLAPNDFPWKTGPFWIVRVALSMNLLTVLLKRSMCFDGEAGLANAVNMLDLKDYVSAL